MPRKSKIEEYQLESFIVELLQADPDMSHLEIARRCSEKAQTDISNMSIKRYLEAQQQHEQREKKAVVMQDRRRMLKVVNQEIDIIQLQYTMTHKLHQRFEMMDNLPELFDERLKQLQESVERAEDPEGLIGVLSSWSKDMNMEFKRKIYEITALNKELRENSKFLVELREKAFEFSLIQEYLFLFMEEFRKVDQDAYDVAVQKIAANPKMQRIVEQQQSIRGEI